MQNSNPIKLNLLRRASVGDILRRTAGRHPDDVAVVFRDTPYTYKTLNAAVNRCANSLLKLGVKPGDRIAILSHNCDSYLILLFALFKIGAVATPLNFMLKGNEIEYIINDATPVMFFVEDALVDGVQQIKKSLASVKHFGVFALKGETPPAGWMKFDDLTGGSDEEPSVAISGDAPATLLYTSGTESMPKGVLNCHLNFYATLLSAYTDLDLEKKDIILLSIPLFHVAGIYLSIAVIGRGSKVIMEYAPDPMEILAITKSYGVNYWVYPPTLYTVLPLMPGFKKEDLSSLEKCISFGAYMPDNLLRQWMEMLPGARFMNYYGQTESSPLGTSLPHEDMLRKPGSIGKAHLPLEIKIFDDDDREVERGAEGEIVMRGPSIMLGYYKNGEKTEEAFRNGWLHTGDIGRMDEEGYIFFIDRKKDVIKSGGENVSSREVEEVLFTHPKVMEAAVVGLPDPYWIEAVSAAIVPRPGQTIDPEEIKAFCKERLAGYKAPKNVFILDALPKNPSGKILKRLLREQLGKQLAEKPQTA